MLPWRVGRTSSPLGWCAELRQVKAHLKSLFAHPIVAAPPAAFPHTLLGAERSKTGCKCAKAAGNQTAAFASHARAQHGGFFCLVSSNSSGPSDNKHDLVGTELPLVSRLSAEREKASWPVGRASRLMENLAMERRSYRRSLSHRVQAASTWISGAPDILVLGLSRRVQVLKR
jgi:hypothetical protein